MSSSQVVQEPAVDAVVMGMGVTGGIIATELSIAGYKVVGIDKGPFWDYTTDFAPLKYDEWGAGLQRKFDHPLPLSSVTIRNTSDQFALPVRRYTMPIQYHALGHGVGGAALHYGGAMGRMGSWAYQMYSQTVEKYGEDFLNTVNPHSDLEDWPMTYDEYEPYYVDWERAWGLTGTNQGPLVPMSANYPMKPHPSTPVATMFQSAAESLGYSPYPQVTSLASESYVNQYGVSINPCVYDGWCGGICQYACETGAKASSGFRVVPAAMKTGNFTLVTNCYLFRVDFDSSSGLATAVRYIDPEGVIHVQPATIFWCGLWGYNIIRMMLLSGIGTPYDPVTITGSVGRGLTNGYTPYLGTSVKGTLDNVGGNSYPAGNGQGGGYCMYDLMDDNFDHTGLNFIGGAYPVIGTYLGSGPQNIVLAGSSTAASMGSTYKQSLQNMYLQSKVTVSGTYFAPDLPNTDNYIDLDPNYTDQYGDPIARETWDWTPNTYNGATFLAPVMAKVFEKMGASNVTVSATVPPGSANTDWWGAHQRSGCRVGINPSTSVFNKYNQAWECNNFFAAGEITNTTGDTVPSGTHIVGPQVYVAAEGMKKYLTSPGPLV